MDNSQENAQSTSKVDRARIERMSADMAKANVAKAVSASGEGGLGETIRVIVEALLIALVIRTFLFQPFNIPSGSLIPTLLIGDYLFVSKYSYGYSHYSLPLSPPLQGVLLLYAALLLLMIRFQPGGLLGELHWRLEH